jgi:hypothetical protein
MHAKTTIEKAAFGSWEIRKRQSGMIEKSKNKFFYH